VPSGLIKDQNSVCTWGDFGRDLVEMKLHGFGVAGGWREGRTGSEFGAESLRDGERLHLRLVLSRNAVRSAGV
jgi:hypothetical protein